MLDSFLRGATNAGTLGFNDEILGAALAPILKMIRPDLFGKESIGDVYKQARDTVRQQDEKAIENHPYSNILGNVGGSGLLALPSNSLKQAVKLGTLYGAGYGVGSNTNNTIEGILQDVGANAGLGGLLGGAGHAATGALAKGYNAVKNTDIINKITDKASNLINNLKEDLVNSKYDDLFVYNGFKNTKGKGEYFHGANQPIEQLRNSKPIDTNDINDKFEKVLLGPGFYATDSIKAADEYARTIPHVYQAVPGEGYIYKVKPKEDIKFYNYEEPLNDTSKLKLEKFFLENGLNNGILDPNIEIIGKELTRLHSKLKLEKLFLENGLNTGISFVNGIPSIKQSGPENIKELNRTFKGLNDYVRSIGARGGMTSHIKSSYIQEPHEIFNFFYPQKDLEIELVNPRDYMRKLSLQGLASKNPYYSEGVKNLLQNINSDDWQQVLQNSRDIGLLKNQFYLDKQYNKLKNIRMEDKDTNELKKTSLKMNQYIKEYPDKFEKIDQVSRKSRGMLENKTGDPKTYTALKNIESSYEKVLPYRRAEALNSLNNPDPDQISAIFNQSPSNDTNYASKLYNALDAKGQAAARYGMVSKAFDSVYDKKNDYFNIGKLVNVLDQISSAKGLGLKGGPKTEIDGLKNLIDHLELANPYDNIPKIFDRVLGSEGLGRLMNTKNGRYFLLSSSKFKAGSPQMQKALDKFISAAQLGALQGTLSNLNSKD